MWLRADSAHTVQVKARPPSTPLISELSTPHCLPPALQHIRTGLKAELDAQEVAAEKDEDEPLQFVVLDLSASPSECWWRGVTSVLGSGLSSC